MQKKDNFLRKTRFCGRISCKMGLFYDRKLGFAVKLIKKSTSFFVFFMKQIVFFYKRILTEWLSILFVVTILQKSNVLRLCNDVLRYFYILWSNLQKNLGDIRESYNNSSLASLQDPGHLLLPFVKSFQIEFYAKRG